MSRFNDCLKLVLAHEGGKIGTDDPTDRGGRTFAGITQRTFDAYRTKHALPPKDVFQIADNEISDIYFGGYWMPLCCSQLPPGLDYVCFDAAVNCGPRNAAKWLQTALGMSPGEVDGVIGRMTLQHVADVINCGDTESVISHFQDLRKAHYAKLISSDSTQKRFEKGWNNRLLAVTIKAQEMA